MPAGIAVLAIIGIGIGVYFYARKKHNEQVALDDAEAIAITVDPEPENPFDALADLRWWESTWGLENAPEPILIYDIEREGPLDTEGRVVFLDGR